MGVLNSFLPGGGEFAHQKNCPGVLRWGMSDLELTDTLFVISDNVRQFSFEIHIKKFPLTLN